MPASRRAAVRSVVAGPGVGAAALPLALHVSARIAERNTEDFLYDPPSWPTPCAT
jgi:hypothetical protein